MKAEEPTPLFIQDVIEILTNIKLKHGNLPVYIDQGLTYVRLEQSDDFGIYAEVSETCKRVSISVDA